MDHSEFIEKIASYVKKFAGNYGIKVYSPIIAQAILESGWGTSKKAQYNNYFGLKYRKNRVDCNSGYIEDGGSEQNPDGTYSELPSDTSWYAFESMEMGVKGYFEFTNIDNYANLKGVTDARQYLENIKADGYATSLTYVDDVYAVIERNNLTQYDNVEKGSRTMRVGLISGHGAGDSGAVGCGYKEADLTVEVVKLLDERFRNAGIETKVYPYENNAYADAKNGGLVVDFSDCNYVLEIHFNACVNDQDGNGRVTGTEIWVTPREVGVTVEEKILANMEALGFTNRGVKSTDFLVINRVKDTGVSSALVETCFIDDKDDVDLFQNKKSEVIEAIVKGVADGFGVDASGSPVTAEPTPTPEPVPTPAPTPEPAKKSVDEIAQEVLKGSWGNGADRKAAIEAAGYNYSEVQGRVNELCGSNAKIEAPAPAKKSSDEIAQEVLNGAWGNGDERKQKLEAAGYNYSEIQSKVNTLCGAPSPAPAPAKKSVDEIAQEVIKGSWGNGADRKAAIEAAGYNYSEVQGRVNELLG